MNFFRISLYSFTTNYKKASHIFNDYTVTSYWYMLAVTEKQIKKALTTTPEKYGEIVGDPCATQYAY